MRGGGQLDPQGTRLRKSPPHLPLPGPRGGANGRRRGRGRCKRGAPPCRVGATAERTRPVKKSVIVGLCLLAAAATARAQTAGQKKETIAYLRHLQTREGGFLPSAQADKAGLRA